MANPKRLIVFLELVHGCKNKKCPSYGTVCNYGKYQQFISENTLARITKELATILYKDNPFENLDFWAYGCGDSLDHPYLESALRLLRENLGAYGRVSMAIDSRRDPPEASNWKPINNWYRYLDKVKIIHKQPETFDWIERARKWYEWIPLPMSHKLITNHISSGMWDTWIKSDFISELKAVPWHDINLGTDNPKFTKRPKITTDKTVPTSYEEYPGKPVRRVMVGWQGILRRCLVSPTSYKNLKDLILGEDEICKKCFPLTGGELVKFHKDRLSITPSASCVSDGYFSIE